jgi:hypothetical protein
LASPKPYGQNDVEEARTGGGAGEGYKFVVFVVCDVYLRIVPKVITRNSKCAILLGDCRGNIPAMKNFFSEVKR